MSKTQFFLMDLVEKLKNQFPEYRVEISGFSILGKTIYDGVSIHNVKRVKDAYALVHRFFEQSSLSYRYLQEGQRELWPNNPPEWFDEMFYYRSKQQIDIQVKRPFHMKSDGDYYKQLHGNLRIHVDDIPFLATSKEEKIAMLREEGRKYPHSSIDYMQRNSHVHSLEVRGGELWVAFSGDEAYKENFFGGRDDLPFEEAVQKMGRKYVEDFLPRFRFEEGIQAFWEGVNEELPKVTRKYIYASTEFGRRYGTIMEAAEKARLQAIQELKDEGFPCGYAWIGFHDEHFVDLWKTIHRYGKQEDSDPENEFYHRAMFVTTPFQNVYVNEKVAKRMADVFSSHGISCSVRSNWD